MNKKYKIVFFGTPEFAEIILKKLIKTKFKPIVTITCPDKLIGRKQILSPSLTKKISINNKIDVWQPKSLNNNDKITNKLLKIQPDLFIVTAYGLILPKKILDIPKYGCINIHPSLLPKYRGASPIHQSILSLDKQTGVSIILMDEKMDHGDIIIQQEIEIKLTTYKELSKKLANIGADLLIEILPKWFKNKLKPIPQNHQQASFTYKIKKTDGKINWNQSAKKIEASIRAYNLWPNSYTILDNKILKIIEANILKIKKREPVGKVFLSKDKKICVSCQKNALILEKIQIQGKKIITSRDFYNGHPDIINFVLL
ncbi:methionyl-tRNA formyltransferase [Patescibacteria group bacterium]|nr:methionyl-tRNA formyltransferase [Patescibacteria group bacterium]